MAQQNTSQQAVGHKDVERTNGNGQPNAAQRRLAALAAKGGSHRKNLASGAIAEVLPARVDPVPFETEVAYQALVEASPIIFYQAEGLAARSIRYISPQLETSLGYQPDKWRTDGRAWETALYPADRQPVLGELAAHEAARSDALTLEYRLVGRDGRVRWFRDQARVTWLADGRADVRGILVEISGQKEELAAVQRRNRELAEQVRQLQAQNDELDAFAHTVAHDLKSPLAVLLGFADMLQTEYGASERPILAEGVAGIVDSARRADNIIDELLLLAEMRQLDEVTSQPLDMAAVVSETLRRVDHLIKGRRAAVSLPRQWPRALGQPGWVQQIWINYITNAIKYGGRPPAVTLGAGTEPGGMARFWVLDNGPGIDVAARPRLFTPFSQLDAVRAQGHGLGLSIVRRLANRLGGQVGLESPNGQGSKFWFTLPLAA